MKKGRGKGMEKRKTEKKTWSTKKNRVDLRKVEKDPFPPHFLPPLPIYPFKGPRTSVCGGLDHDDPSMLIGKPGKSGPPKGAQRASAWTRPLRVAESGVEMDRSGFRILRQMVRFSLGTPRQRHDVECTCPPLDSRIATTSLLLLLLHPVPLLLTP